MKDEPKKFGDLLPPSVTPEPSVYRAPSLPSLGRPVDKEGVEGDDCTIVQQTRQFLPQLLSDQRVPHPKTETAAALSLFSLIGDELGEPTTEGAMDAYKTELISVGEEADHACCEICKMDRLLYKGVCCEACGAFYCRNTCWPKHNCGVMNDWDGRIVKVGDYLKYVDGNQTLWTVVSIPGSYVRIHAAIGRRKDGREIPIKPRLMRLQ